jgi:hypothetical protein
MPNSDWHSSLEAPARHRNLGRGGDLNAKRCGTQAHAGRCAGATLFGLEDEGDMDAIRHWWWPFAQLLSTPIAPSSRPSVKHSTAEDAGNGGAVGAV